MLLVGLLAGSGIGGAFVLWQAAPPQPGTGQATGTPAIRVDGPPAVATTPIVLADPPLATEAEIASAWPAARSMVRLKENPRVFVLLFTSLEEQGAALNRMAALIEKAGLPRDRLLEDGELAAAIARSGDTAATWYLGHDYAGADLARFFNLAERDGIRLNALELWVRDRFEEARALTPAGTEVALVSVPNPDTRLDAPARAAILRHEIGHGHFFTRPDLAAHVLRVWRERFTEQERAAIAGFLAREGYDPSNERLMANEAMAYLLFTPDPRFFDAHHVGMAGPALERLRATMRDGLPLP
jgi:hypothetical protein